MAFRILSMDGGAGVNTYVRCLNYLEQERPGFLSQVDMITGNSAGSYAAIPLVQGLNQLAPGEDASEVTEQAVAFVDDLFSTIYSPGNPMEGSLADSELFQAYTTFLKGKDAMYNSTDIMQYLVQHSDVEGVQVNKERKEPIKLSFLTGRANEPWGPTMLSNWGNDALPNFNLLDATMTSGSYPMCMPINKGCVDGAMFVNSPSACALGQVVENMGRDMLDEVVILSLGADAGSSSLSNRHLPNEEPIPASPPPKLSPTQIHPPENVEEAEEMLHQLQSNIVAALQSKFGWEFHDPDNDTLPGGQNWGWRQWIADPRNLAFFVQVYINNAGLGATWQCQQLLGKERVLRLAPVGIAGTNDILLATYLGFVSMSIALSDFTAELWATPSSSKKYNFKPNLQESIDWLDEYWIED